MARDGIADLTYINPGYQPGRFPIIGAGELPFLISNAKGGSQAIDAWYRKYAAQGDEGREILPRLLPRSRLLPFREEEDHGAGRHQGHEDPAGACDHGHLRGAAWRHQRAIQRAGSARPSREGRCRSGHLPVGLGPAVRHRQGDQISHRRAALCDHLRLRVLAGHLQPDVGGAEEGDRRPLHQRMGIAGRRTVGRLRACRHCRS